MVTIGEARAHIPLSKLADRATMADTTNTTTVHTVETICCGDPAVFTGRVAVSPGFCAAGCWGLSFNWNRG